MAFTEPIELFCAPSGLITDILQRRLLFPSFLSSLNVTCGEREGGTGRGAALSRITTTVTFCGGVRRQHAILFDYPNGKTTTCRRRAGIHAPNKREYC